METESKAFEVLKKLSSTLHFKNIYSILSQLLRTTNQQQRDVLQQRKKDINDFPFWSALYFTESSPCCFHFNTQQYRLMDFLCCGTKCEKNHKCLLCNSNEHGILMRDERQCFLCPEIKAFYDEVEILTGWVDEGLSLVENLINALQNNLEVLDSFWIDWLRKENNN